MKWIPYALLFVLALVGLSYAFTAMNVATAPARVMSQTMQTDNIIQSYEWFYDVNASFDARQAQVEQFASLLATETNPTERSQLRIELTAMQQTCRELANNYNANSQKLNKSIFKGWSLPASLDALHCEVNTK